MFDMVFGREASKEINFNEIFKLDHMLTEAHIPHELIERPGLGGYQVCYPVEQPELRICDAILNVISYGHEDGLLEIMGLLTDEEYANDTVKGGLTAEDVFSRIKKDYESHYGTGKE